jgi:hypothetical protein
MDRTGWKAGCHKTSAYDANLAPEITVFLTMFSNEARKLLKNPLSFGKSAKGTDACHQAEKETVSPSEGAVRTVPALRGLVRRALERFAVRIQTRFSQTGTLVDPSKLAQPAFPDFFRVFGRASQLHLGQLK